MNPDQTPASNQTDSAKLSFDRTIERQLVHRAAVSEVFLTDILRVDANNVLIGAQLPRCHGYFSDHAGWSKTVDPLMIFEVARQATLASAHELDVPADTILISSDFELDLTDIDLFRDRGVPTPVCVANRFDWSAYRQGVPRAGECTQSISVHGNIAATYRSSGRLMSHAQMLNLRTEQRGEAPPLTTQMTNRSEGIALQPGEVGRYNPLNVVLARLEIENGSVQAVVAPPWQNRALFDHEYDHLTMQILTEAARQIAFVVLRKGAFVDVPSWYMKRLRGTFSKFAEIDLPVIIKTRIPDPQSADVTLTVVIVQTGEELATLELTFAPVAAGGKVDWR